MSIRIRKAEYYYANIKDEPGEAYKLLNLLGETGINILAFTAIPTGPDHAQLTIFPESSSNLEMTCKKANIALVGPYSAFIVQGDDELGALASIHVKLFNARVNIYASNGVADGKGSFGYVIYVRPEEIERAAKALNV